MEKAKVRRRMGATSPGLGILQFLRYPLICLIAFTPLLRGQEAEVYHPELEWKTIETDHFFVHFHNGAERSGWVVAKIAEEIYEPITSLYNHKPDQKVSFIIKDYDDYSNGAAFFYDNKVEIWAPSMDFDFRGTHNWLRNVVTHEFTHIVQIQTTMKFGRRIPAFYLQWLGYESERRPDVLYGYPNVIASYPVSGFVVPAWFAEGVAQYNRPQLRYDFWDSHRDMILRSYVLKDSMLTWNQMGVFGKTSLGNESSYNAGFAFVHYIAQKYGIARLSEISRNLSSLSATTIDGAIEKALGKDGKTVYNEWSDELKRDYARRVEPVKVNLQEGTPIIFVDDFEELKQQKDHAGGVLKFKLSEGVSDANRDQCGLFVDMGYANRFPTFSSDGRKLAFVSTIGASYLGQSQLIVGELGGKFKAIATRVGSEVSWSPDGKKLYFSRTDNSNPHFSSQADLYVFDLEKEEEDRVTFGRRALSPSVSPDGKTLVCAVGGDGTSNLATMNTDASNFQLITSFKSGEQVYAPKWSPAGDRIVFDYSVADGRDIVWIRPDGSDMEFLITHHGDARSGVFTPDGSHILFSSDKTGIFNIYSYDVPTKHIAQITNVLGGAFMPTTNDKGVLVYSLYTSQGYKLYTMKEQHSLPEGNHDYLPLTVADQALPLPVYAQVVSNALDEFDWEQLRSYDDSGYPTSQVKPYRNIFTSLSFVPFFRFDNYNTKNKALESVKAGLYLFSNEVLEKLSMFAGVAFNTKFERDLFVTFRYTGRLPLLYNIGLEPVTSLEMYNITRKTDNFVTLNPFYAPAPVDVSYNLSEYDLALTQTLIPNSASIEFRYAHSRYTSTIETFATVIDSPNVILFSGSDFLYLLSNTLSLKFTLEAIRRANTADINPIGRKVTVQIVRELNKFNTDGSYDPQQLQQGVLAPLYQHLNFTRVELNWREHFPFFFKNHSLTFKLRGSSILENTVDDFFDSYAGGLVGMKGYPFYSIGGNELAVAGLEYRFPLVENIDVRFLQFYFDKFYASFYGDFGNAWNGKATKLRDFKGDVGAELRLESFSWYSYPTRMFFNASYGLNEFEKDIRGKPVKYGKEWRFYFGLLFGFDFD